MSKRTTTQILTLDPKPGEAISVPDGVKWVKVHPVSLLCYPGPALTYEGKIFLDAKLYDTPSQVGRMVELIVADGRFSMVSIATHDPRAWKAAWKARGDSPLILAGLAGLSSEAAPEYSHVEFIAARADAVILPAYVGVYLRDDYPDTTFVCPGIRNDGQPKGTHVETVTLQQARDAGLDYVVVNEENYDAHS